MNAEKRCFKLLIFGFFIFQFSLSVVAQENDEETWFDTSLPREERITALISAMTVEEKISQLLNASPSIERLGIPAYDWWNECLHGVARNGRATVFPQPIGLAATFDKELVYSVFSAVSDEARAKFNISQKLDNRGTYAGITFWTPNINIFRDPRWGRGMETYGEDPYLTGVLGSQAVKGIQGDHPDYLKASACAKHFAVHSGPEALRHEFDAVVSNKDLYETYLPAFEMLVREAHVESVMCAYNRVLGEPACGSQLLLQEILRNKWNFSGHVVSDCGAIVDFHKDHKVTSDGAESAALALQKGTDLNCGHTYDALTEALGRELITEKIINDRLRNMLQTRMKLGLLDPPEDNPFNALPESVICSDKHREIAREAAVKSIVLLKNKNILPLNKNIRRLYIVGPQANNSEVLLGNYYGMSDHLVNILEGISGRVSAGTSINYKQGCLPYRENVNPMDWTTGEAMQSDAVIAVMGFSALLEGEEGEALASDSRGDRLDLNLPENQINFLKKLRSKGDTPIIVVMTGGSPVTMPEINELADAILWVWYPGQEGGLAVADIIFGDRSPSGKLPVTFPNSVDQLPPYEDYSMKGRTYRYMVDEPLYPFGFGLSYSTFTFGEMQLSDETINKGESVKASVMVTNRGGILSDEVVQLYLVTPKAGNGEPLFSLKGFERISLQPGKSKKVTFELVSDEIKAVNNDGEKVFLKGEYIIIIGSSSPGKRSLELGASKPVSASFRLL